MDTTALRRLWSSWQYLSMTLGGVLVIKSVGSTRIEPRTFNFQSFFVLDFCANNAVHRMPASWGMRHVARVCLRLGKLRRSFGFSGPQKPRELHVCDIAPASHACTQTAVAARSMHFSFGEWPPFPIRPARIDFVADNEQKKLVTSQKIRKSPTLVGYFLS